MEEVERVHGMQLIESTGNSGEEFACGARGTTGMSAKFGYAQTSAIVIGYLTCGYGGRKMVFVHWQSGSVDLTISSFRASRPIPCI